MARVGAHPSSGQHVTIAKCTGLERAHFWLGIGLMNDVGIRSAAGASRVCERSGGADHTYLGMRQRPVCGRMICSFAYTKQSTSDVLGMSMEVSEAHDGGAIMTSFWSPNQQGRDDR